MRHAQAVPAPPERMRPKRRCGHDGPGRAWRSPEVSMNLYRDEGVVLRTHKLGEADRIVVLMTAAHGKVRAVAKGVRKTKSRLGGRLEPPSRVSLLIYDGRDLDVITQAETLEHYPALRQDLDRLTDALSLAEAVDQVAQEGEPNPALYRMLTGALQTLAATDTRPPLLVAAFYW